VPSVSSDRNDLLDGIFRYPAECILASVEENQRDGFLEVVQAFFLRAPLAVGPRELRAKRDEPISVSFDDCSKLVGHLYALLTRTLSHLPERPATSFPVLLPRRHRLPAGEPPDLELPVGGGFLVADDAGVGSATSVPVGLDQSAFQYLAETESVRPCLKITTVQVITPGQENPENIAPLAI
jgi:hypothetical protein